MSYGYEDAGAYSVPPPGGYLDAAAYLDGPGTHAYLSSTSQNGTHNTSYAFETARGGIYELGTTTYSNGTVETGATYDISGGGYSYYRSVDTFRPSQPISPGYGSGYYGAGYEDPNHLVTYRSSSFQTESSPAGSYTESDQQSFSSVFFNDGSSVSHYSESSREFTEDGHTVPGSISTYSVSGFDYGNGYTAYTHS